MTAQRAQPEPGTAVAERKDPDEGIGKLPPEMQQQIQLRRMMNKVAAQIAGLSWGQNISADTARALAEWGRRYNVDVTQEIDILGNRVYLNARFYLRRLGELIAGGLVDYAYADHIHPDARLEALGPAGQQEAERRTFERVRYNVPEKAAAIVAFHVKMRALSEDIVGVSWCGNGVRKSDPVGDAEPTKTAESRAARRALRQIVSHVPALAGEVESVMTALPEVEARIQQEHAALKAPSNFSKQGVTSDGYDALPRRQRLPAGRTVEPEVMHARPLTGRPLPPDPYKVGKDADTEAGDAREPEDDRLDEELSREGR